jgi:membrane protease subunit (stomatin/prohibitin family)
MEPELNIPVNVQARGWWGVRVQDSRSLIIQLVGTLTDLRTERIEEYFMGEILQRFSDIVSKFLVVNKTPLFQVNAHLTELSQRAQDEIRSEFARFGLEVVNFNVQQVTIPAEEIKRIQDILLKKAEIDQISKSTVGPAYVTMKTFETLEKAAGTEGGTAGGLLAGGLGLGAGLGAGVPVGQQLGQALSPQGAAQQPAKEDPLGKLQKLKQALDQGLITKDEFEAKKAAILKDF